MADVVVLEFAAPDAVSICDSVNGILSDGCDTWELPPGMLTGVAGAAGDKLIVIEV